jgi:hypothetical protein
MSSVSCRKIKSLEKTVKLTLDNPVYTCCVWNVRSLNSEGKARNVLAYLDDNNIDIAFLNETWLFDEQCFITAILREEGSYTLFNTIRPTKTCGGGVSIFVNKSLKCFKLPSSSLSLLLLFFRILKIEIKLLG